jgi:hypothetical protein
MTLRVFTEDSTCLSRVHCGVCRAGKSGRQFRESLAKAFTLPADAPDFDCPHGYPWGYDPKQSKVIAPMRIDPTYNPQNAAHVNRGRCCS